MFKAFRLAVPKLLAALPEPAGKVTPPPSPEKIAENAVEQTLAAFFAPSKIYKDFEAWRQEFGPSPDFPRNVAKWLRYQENLFYEMERAKHDLQIKPIQEAKR